jgi:hypothetical protein
MGLSIQPATGQTEFMNPKKEMNSRDSLIGCSVAYQLTICNCLKFGCCVWLRLNYLLQKVHS